MTMCTQRIFLISIMTLILSPVAFAATGAGGYSIGLQLGSVGSSQAQMNELIKRANTREGGISTGELNSAYEAAVNFTYRFKSTIYALQFRPSYFYQDKSGSGAGGDFNYGLQGFTLFPVMRIYPLENAFMKFYMQLGLGYGRVSGHIEENNATAPTHGSVDFSGGTFGALVGMGAEFCFTPNHCLSLEGDYRYLNYDRLLTTSSDGTFATGSLSQYSVGSEVEFDNEDLNARMGGVMYMLGYNYWF